MKILYYYGRLNIGGAERSSVRLLNAFVRQGHEVHLLLRWQGGALEDELEPRIRIIAFRRANRITEKYRGRHWHGIPIMTPDVFIARLFQIVRGFVLRTYLSIRKPTYDLALVGYHGLDPMEMLRTCRANVNGMMMRSTASVTDHERRTARYLRDPKRVLDAYICVSKHVKDAMIANYPELEHKVHHIYNIIPDTDPIRQYELPDAYKDKTGKLLILTLCRIEADVKGLFRMIEACQELVKQNRNFCWFIVGDGEDKLAVSERIIESGLEDVMIMLPRVHNPFPYYLHADLVAVLSFHEGLSGVVNEAKMMKAPLIATRFSSISEQITHGVNGYVVDNNLHAIIEGMSILLTNHDLRKSLARNEMPDVLLDNDSKIKQFEAITSAVHDRSDPN